MENKEKEEFYRECGRILGVETEVKEIPIVRERFDRETGKFYMPDSNKNRWNGRDPGNGRYPGFGIIRIYAEDKIHVSLSKPNPMNRVCNSIQEVYDLLKEIA